MRRRVEEREILVGVLIFFMGRGFDSIKVGGELIWVKGVEGFFVFKWFEDDRGVMESSSMFFLGLVSSCYGFGGIDV